jgi:hypothetical protein
MPAQRLVPRVGAALALTVALSGCAAAYAPDEAAVSRPNLWADLDDAADEVADDVAEVVTPAQEDTLADATPEQRACIHRNDDVVPWTSAHEATRSWDERGAQRAHQQIMKAMRKRFHTRGGSSFEITNGLLGYGLDTANSRLIMLADPDIIDLAEFRRWTAALAVRANKAAKVRGEPVTVTIQPGCFSAAKTIDVLYRGTNSGAAGFAGQVSLDGRLHFFAHPRQRAAVQQFRARHGPIVAVRPCGPCPGRNL